MRTGLPACCAWRTGATTHAASSKKLAMRRFIRRLCPHFSNVSASNRTGEMAAIWPEDRYWSGDQVGIGSIDILQQRRLLNPIRLRFGVTNHRADSGKDAGSGKVRNPYFSALTMLAKLTSKNQLTLPKAVTNAVGPAEYFDVEAKEGQIVLTPVRIQRADAVRAKLAELQLTEQDIADAVAWARRPARKPRK
jgi:hypothetical protein